MGESLLVQGRGVSGQRQQPPLGTFRNADSGAQLGRRRLSESETAGEGPALSVFLDPAGHASAGSVEDSGSGFSGGKGRRLWISFQRGEETDPFPENFRY